MRVCVSLYYLFSVNFSCNCNRCRRFTLSPFHQTPRYRFTHEKSAMTSKLEQILLIEPPHELIFKGPFVKPVVSTLTLMNPSDKVVAFKIEFTTRQSYGVKPIYGVANPKTGTQIAVRIQSFDYPANRTDTMDLTVKTFVVNPLTEYPKDGTIVNWNNVEDCRKMESKLKCVFVMPSVEQAASDTSTEAEFQNTSTEVKDSHDKQEEFEQNMSMSKTASDTSTEAEFENATTEVKDLHDKREEFKENMLISKAGSDTSTEADIENATTQGNDLQDIIKQHILEIKKDALRMEEEMKTRNFQNSTAGGTQHLDVQNRDANFSFKVVGLGIVLLFLSFIFWNICMSFI